MKKFFRISVFVFAAAFCLSSCGGRSIAAMEKEARYEAAYSEGYEAGHDEGYSEGYREACKEIAFMIEDEYLWDIPEDAMQAIGNYLDCGESEISTSDAWDSYNQIYEFLEILRDIPEEVEYFVGY